MFTIENHPLTEYSVYLPDCAGAAEKKYAGVLASYLQKTVGEEIPVVNVRRPRQFILKDQKKGGHDGVLIEIGEDVLLSGTCARAVAYAVYTFLEKFLGWRFLTPEFETRAAVPGKIGRTKFSFTAPLDYRLVLWADEFKNDYFVKSKINSEFSGDLPAEDGGGLYYVYGTDFEKYRYGCHTYGVYLPPEKYFAEHPEYFALNEDGTRNKKQPCLSHPEVEKIIAEGVEKALENSPGARFVSVSQNDTEEGFCHCEKCTANRKKYRSDGANELLFVNKIAKRLKAKFPNVLFETLAYNYSTVPPVGLKAEKNVSVRFALMRCCREHALSDPACPFAEKMRGYFEGWSKVSENIYLWDYTANFRDYYLPLKNYSLFYANVRFFLRKNVKGIMEQYIHDAHTGGFCELWAYMQGKLLWNPEMPYGEYIDAMREFLRLYYGRGGEYLYDYIVLHAAAPGINYHYGPYVTYENYMPAPAEGEKLNFDFIERARDLFARACSLAEGAEKERVEKAELELDWYELCALHHARRLHPQEKNGYSEKLNAFIGKTKKFGLDKLREGGGLIGSVDSAENKAPEDLW